jgi:hypothetical protein
MCNTKICRNCKQEKVLEKYQLFKSHNGKEYLRHTCRDCINLRTLSKETPSDKRQKANREKKRRELWEYSMFHQAKQRAIKKSIPFDIDQQYIKSILTESCPILGIPLKKGIGSFSDNSPSLDRINPNLGYVKGNVKVISDRANRIKRDASIEELKAIINYMENNL